MHMHESHLKTFDFTDERYKSIITDEKIKELSFEGLTKEEERVYGRLWVDFVRIHGTRVSGMIAAAHVNFTDAFVEYLYLDEKEKMNLRDAQDYDGFISKIARRKIKTEIVEPVKQINIPTEPIILSISVRKAIPDDFEYAYTLGARYFKCKSRPVSPAQLRNAHKNWVYKYRDKPQEKEQFLINYKIALDAVFELFITTCKNNGIELIHL